MPSKFDNIHFDDRVFYFKEGSWPVPNVGERRLQEIGFECIYGGCAVVTFDLGPTTQWPDADLFIIDDRYARYDKLKRAGVVLEWAEKAREAPKLQWQVDEAAVEAEDMRERFRRDIEAYERMRTRKSVFGNHQVVLF